MTDLGIVYSSASGPWTRASAPQLSQPLARGRARLQIFTVGTYNDLRATAVEVRLVRRDRGLVKIGMVATALGAAAALSLLVAVAFHERASLVVLTVSLAGLYALGHLVERHSRSG